MTVEEVLFAVPAVVLLGFALVAVMIAARNRL